MRSTKRLFLRYSWLIYSLLISLLAILLFQQSIVLSREHRLAAARSHWDMRPFSRYRLLIEENNGNCQQEAEVKGERIVASISNTCRLHARSINNLFKLIEGTPPTVYSCVAQGCACDTVLSTYAMYDSRFGYPTEIAFEWTTRPNMQHPDYWRYLVRSGRPPHCPPTTFRRTISVRSLAPIQ